MNPSFNVNQVAAALNHLGSTHLIISLEANLPRKPPRSTISILQTIVPGLEKTKVESELVPTLKSIITVDNTSGRADASSYRAFTHYEDVFQDGSASSEDLSKIELTPDEIINIQFTSGYGNPSLWEKSRSFVANIR